MQKALINTRSIIVVRLENFYRRCPLL